MAAGILDGGVPVDVGQQAQADSVVTHTRIREPVDHHLKSDFQLHVL